ncbi:MAG: iron-sulfur cluster assembly scaffold protein [Planctomycetes bacterium]|nr:iron-sulfur cluster assembly scaffold protein [Planctomycetota bacterium]
MASMSRLPESLRAHVVAPRCAGEPDGGFTHRGEARNAACRDHLVLYLALDGASHVRAAGFRATGCPAVMGTASAAAELLAGLVADASLPDALRARFTAAHGEPLPLHRHAWALVEEAVGAALASPSDRAGADGGTQAR